MATIQERLEAIRAELARQDEAWAKARRALASTPARTLIVANERLEAIAATGRELVAKPSGLRA
jgi:hypothetical protein